MENVKALIEKIPQPSTFNLDVKTKKVIEKEAIFNDKSEIKE
jgi:phage host-nuclease inhibitor protein Gam